MDLNKKINKRIQANKFGTSYYSKNKIKIWDENTLKRLKKYSNLTSDTTQGLLSSVPGDRLASFLANKFNINFDDYDSAIDQAFNQGIGGSPQYHHLIDGNHSLWGALNQVKNVSPDDSFFDEFLETTEHLFRDTLSKSGTNILFNMKKDTFDFLAHNLNKIGISKNYFADFLTVNGPELLGGGLAIIALILGTDTFNLTDNARLFGTLLVSSFAGANPLLIPIAGACVFTYFKNIDFNSNNLKIFLRKSFKGAFITGSIILVSGIFSTIWISISAAILTAIALNYGFNNYKKIYNKFYNKFNDSKNSFIKIKNELKKQIEKREIILDFSADKNF